MRLGDCYQFIIFENSITLSRLYRRIVGPREDVSIEFHVWWSCLCSQFSWSPVGKYVVKWEQTNWIFTHCGVVSVVPCGMSKRNNVCCWRQKVAFFVFRAILLKLICCDVHTSNSESFDALSIFNRWLWHRCFNPSKLWFASPAATKWVTSRVKISDFTVFHHVTKAVVFSRIRSCNDIHSAIVQAS